MLHPDSELSIEVLNSALEELENSGELEAMRRRHHLPEKPDGD